MTEEKVKEIVKSLDGITITEWEGIKKAIDEMAKYSIIKDTGELDYHIRHYLKKETRERELSLDE